MRQILCFNWPTYGAALLVIVGAGWAVQLDALPPAARWGSAAGGLLAAYGLLASLVASHWIYDRSRIARPGWIAEEFPTQPGHAAILHAGLEEASERLRERWPGTRLEVWDFHSTAVMTERSIERARRTTPAPAASAQVELSALPAAPGTLDCLLLVFAAHEVRRPNARDVLFKELDRILRPGGDVLLVEHLRDAWNVAAFGPGAFHFLPRLEWVRLASVVGWDSAREFAITPFVRVFHWRKPS